MPPRRKKVDSRIRTLIENGVKTHQRSFFVLVGDRGRDQIPNLHYILHKCSVRRKTSALWCYKKDLGFSTHREKRRKEILKLQKRGELALCARAKTEGALMMQKGGTGRAINTRTSTVLTSSGSRDGD